MLSFHTQLEKLVSQAKHVHKDFQDIHNTFPALHLLSNTCFLGKSFKDLMQLSLDKHKTCLSQKQSQSKNKRSILGALLGDSALINQLSANMQKALHIQDTNFAKIYELDKSLVNHLNTLLANEKIHDQDIRTVFQLLKAMGYYLDMTNNRAISFNLRTNQGHSIEYELTSLEKELRILKDALHHTVECTFNKCILSRHLHKLDNETFLLSEQVQLYNIDTHYQILCKPTSENKISSLHLQVGHKIDPNYLILKSGKRIPIESLTNITQANMNLQFITRIMLILGDSPMYEN